MGIIEKFKMVLLSTLAALVIIAHTAQEDYDTHYVREFRPRMLDTGTPRSYEQPWRAVEVEPVLKQTTPDEAWFESSSSRRRRPGRKRKRRLEQLSSEDSIPEERYIPPEEAVRPIVDDDFNSNHKMSDKPKRRRKKLEQRPENWDSTVEERPLKRRGHRRKRPSAPIETWPEFSDFVDYHPKEPVAEVEEYVTSAPLDENNADNYKYYDHDNTQTHYAELENSRQPVVEETDLKYSADQDESYVKPNIDDYKYQDDKDPITDYRNDDSYVRPQLVENKSLSEFTYEDTGSELVPNAEDEQQIARNKVRDKSHPYLTESLKSQLQSEGPIDPQTLKDLLKKSNGTSLSEILQQHNLSLTDLLHGKEKILSILKPEESLESIDNKSVTSEEDKALNKENALLKSETKYPLESASDNPIPIQNTQSNELDTTTEGETIPTTTEKPKIEQTSKRPNIRRFPTAIRRKQRIRPMMNNTTYKSQISRDMIALNARKYFNNRRRNSTHEWKDLIPMMKKNLNTQNITKEPVNEITTTNSIVEEDTTTTQDYENCTTKSTEIESETRNTIDSLDQVDIGSVQENKTNTEKHSTPRIAEQTITITDKPMILQSTTQIVNSSGLRRQAFNNRLKKKRLKQKNLTTESPQDDIVNLFGIPNLVSSSEFVSRTQSPQKTRLDDVTILEDFITTEMPRKETRKKTRYSTTKPVTTPQFVIVPSSTEETAKIEIEEILNDTRTNARLAKILKERNMTLSELVELRERGSSHVHLADIFHNASKEPNPPEPFLSKSLIEPISKETYPLRALLDANIHDTTAKATTDSTTAQVQTTDVNIPVIMNFGNNVNENAENMGIMSLFHNITKNETEAKKRITLKKDSQGALYETSITIVNTTDYGNGNDTTRESRVIHVINDNQDEVVSWNEIFTLMRKNYDNQTGEITRTPTSGLIPAEKIKKPTLEEDLDGDGVIVLEDLQHLKDFDSKIESSSNENININTYERADVPTTKQSGILDLVPSQTKSVTVATASIAGLAMILFLLTYIGYKWQYQRQSARRKSFSDERVPSPVFENRKGHKNNSSSRSISPMLSSNIYTLNTLDSRNGKESPDYMWDSLRKPFQ